MGHGATVRYQVIGVCPCRRFFVGRCQPLANPDHRMLHGQREQIIQRGQFVAIQARTVGKTSRQFVFPGLNIPGLAGGISKLFELPADRTHVGGRAKNNGVGGGQCIPAAWGQMAICINGNQLRIGTCCHGLRHALRVAITRVINNNDADGHSALKSNTSTSAFSPLARSKCDSLLSNAASPAVSFWPLTCNAPRTRCT